MLFVKNALYRYLAASIRERRGIKGVCPPPLAISSWDVGLTFGGSTPHWPHLRLVINCVS